MKLNELHQYVFCPLSHQYMYIARMGMPKIGFRIWLKDIVRTVMKEGFPDYEPGHIQDILNRILLNQPTNMTKLSTERLTTIREKVAGWITELKKAFQDHTIEGVYSPYSVEIAGHKIEGEIHMLVDGGVVYISLDSNGLSDFKCRTNLDIPIYMEAYKAQFEHYPSFAIMYNLPKGHIDDRIRNIFHQENMTQAVARICNSIEGCHFWPRWKEYVCRTYCGFYTFCATGERLP